GHRVAGGPLVRGAAPAYLARRGPPRTPAELADHDFLALPRWHHASDVLVGPDGQPHRFATRTRVTSNNQYSVRQLAVKGLGLSFHVEPEIAAELASGELVRVMPEWSSSVLSVDALMPARARQPPKVRLALQALRAYVERLGRRGRPRPRRRG